MDRPDRAEQFLVDTLEHTIHGPGYFEEVVPNGISALPPFATAHGAYVVAACEQVVLSDFWRPRVYIGKGVPSRWRAVPVRFAHLRARDGLLVSGTFTAGAVELQLDHTGDSVEMEFVIRVPAAAGHDVIVRLDGGSVAAGFAGESVIVRVALVTGQRATLQVLRDGDS